MSSVSVVVPCYNYGRFLEDAVSSVLEDQPGVDVRVLIIDDASSDESAEVARKIAVREPRVEVVVHESNVGNIATFNEGLLEWADGDYCLLLSADDQLTPGALRRAADLLDASPTVGFVYGQAIWVPDGEPLPPARVQPHGWTVWPGHWWLERRFRDAENPISAPAIVVRTALQKRLGGYDRQLPKAADMEMFMRLALHSDVGFLRRVDQAFYRVHTESMSRTVSPLMDLQQRRSVFEKVLDCYGEQLPDAQRLSLLVHRALAREALWAAGRVYDRGRLRRTELSRVLLAVGVNEDECDVSALLAFAVECWPEIRSLALYRTLLSSGRMGPRDIEYLASRKARWWLRRRSWRYRGY